MSFFRPFETMKTSDYFGSFRSAPIRIATTVRRGPFATDNWILCTTLVELQIFPFRENFLTVAFDRRYFLLLRPVPSLSLCLPPVVFSPSVSVSRCGVSKYRAWKKEDSLPTIHRSLVSSTSPNQLFFESPSMEELGSEWIFICRLQK